jgi:hypothetical protein
MDVGLCLRNLGVYPKKSLDDEGKERFHIFSHRDHYQISFNIKCLIKIQTKINFSFFIFIR